MIQVLGLRPYVDRNGRRKLKHAFFGNNWRFEKIQDVFNHEKLTAIIDQIPETERYNMYFTVADCFEDKERALKEQWALPFDVDKIDFPTTEPRLDYSRRVGQAMARALGLPEEDTVCVFSGNGVHLYVLLDYAIRDTDFFEEMRPHYGEMLLKINRELKKSGLSGVADPSVWSPSRLMRLPLTENRKEGKPSHIAEVLWTTATTHAYDLREKSGLRFVEKAEAIPDRVLSSYPPPDTKAVVAECNFLSWAKDHPDRVSEELWYASISITARLENGAQLTHAMSEGHPKYSHDETELKIEQALRAAGPRTCADIDRRWGKCKDCKHFGKITSPILIRGEEYIASEHTGFRALVIPEGGGPPRPGKVLYQDLLKKFQREHIFVSVEDVEDIYIYNGKFWETKSDTRIKEWMTRLVEPKPMGSEMEEFLAQVRVHNVRSLSWFNDQRLGKMNFQNCVLDFKTGQTELHKPEHGFLNILPYDYDPAATSPRWEAFIHDIMDNDQTLVDNLEEMAGYCISGDDYWLHSSLMLIGSGANGKSVFMETLAAVAGEDNVSVLSPPQLEDDRYRANLMHKLFNYSEEISYRALENSEAFKQLSAGGLMTVRKLYKDVATVRNRAKFVMSANNMPFSRDGSYGLLRRLLFIPFKKSYHPTDPNYDPYLKQKLREELPGICNRLIAAYNRLKDRGRIIEGNKSEELKHEFRQLSNEAVTFAEERLEISKELTQVISQDVVYEEYVRYAQDCMSKPMEKRWFFRKFFLAYPHIKATQVKIQGPDEKRIWGIRGVKLVRGAQKKQDEF